MKSTLWNLVPVWGGLAIAFALAPSFLSWQWWAIFGFGLISNFVGFCEGMERSDD